MVSLQLYHLLTWSTEKSRLNLWSVRQISPGFLRTHQCRLSILLYMFLAVPNRYRPVPRLPLISQSRFWLTPRHCASPRWKRIRFWGLLVLDPVLPPSTRLWPRRLGQGPVLSPVSQLMVLGRGPLPQAGHCRKGEGCGGMGACCRFPETGSIPPPCKSDQYRETKEVETGRQRAKTIQ